MPPQDPTTVEDRRRATKVLLELAEEQATSDEIRLAAATNILHAPAYDIDGDTQDALADRIAKRIKAT